MTPQMDKKMITWELAQDRYKLSRFYLETIAIMAPWLVDTKNFMVKDVWGDKDDHRG